MPASPRPAPKRCELPGCDDRFHPGPQGGRRRFCDTHRGRPWLELWAARARAGVTSGQLAARSGISATYVCQLEAGKRFPSRPHMRRLARALGVHLAAIEPNAHTDVDALTRELGATSTAAAS